MRTNDRGKIGAGRFENHGGGGGRLESQMSSACDVIPEFAELGMGS